MGGQTGFWYDEKCFWHSGGNYALVLPVGGYVQPQAAGGLAESPETKRRLKNLMEVSGLLSQLDIRSAPPASDEDLHLIHTNDYLAEFERLSDSGGGELGEHAPFGQGSYEIAALSAGLAKGAVGAVLAGEQRNAYALSRPPGHHCLASEPMGFCVLANIAIAVEAHLAAGAANKVAIVDWDVHHGNGTEAIFYERGDVLTISMHQDNNFPPASGGFEARGQGAGEGFNMNIPLQPGGGHDAYSYAMERIVVPQVCAFAPDIIVVASGFDASGFDPLSRMLASSETFAMMTRELMAVADETCDGRLVLVHEGGYSEAAVPFCGHATIAALGGIDVGLKDPTLERFQRQQPNERMRALQRTIIDEMAEAI